MGPGERLHLLILSGKGRFRKFFAMVELAASCWNPNEW